MEEVKKAQKKLFCISLSEERIQIKNKIVMPSEVF
jgi:hypothetical protein